MEYDPAASFVEDLASEVQCHVCLELFDDPRLLQCGHTFCKNCLSMCEKKSLLSSFIECPMCRQQQKLDKKGVEVLPKNRYVANIVEKLKMKQQSQNSSAVPFPYNLYQPPNSPPPMNTNSPPAMYPAFNDLPPSSNIGNPTMSVLQQMYPDINMSVPSAPPMEETSNSNMYPQSMESPFYPPNPEVDSPYPMDQSQPVIPPPLPPKNNNNIPEGKEEVKQPTEDKRTSGFFNSILSFFIGDSPGANTPSVSPDQEIIPWFCPFTTKPTDCSVLFKRWLEGLWFAPTDFYQKISLQPFQAVYVPFWIFEIVTVVTYTGQICVLSPTNTNTSNSNKKEEVWKEEAGTSAQKHKVMVCSSTEQNSIIVDFITEIGDWNLTKATLRQPQNDAKVDRFATLEVAMQKAKQIVRKKEEDFCQRKLTHETKAEKVSRFTIVDLKFDTKDQKLVFLPVYISNYVYNKAEFKVVISGQSSTIRAQRPYGIGKLGNALSSIGGYMWGKKGA